MSLEDLFVSLRQGARNVAGVNWQVDVCAYLLVASRAGLLPFVDLTPEGYEDADCTAIDGTGTFVQMKELNGGQGEMGPAALAEALAHAEASARGADIIVLTDGSLGSGLFFTGWDSVLSDQSSAGVDKVLAGLATRGYADNEASGIVGRARVVRLPYRIRQISETLLAEAMNVHPTVAGIAISRLTEVLARDSGNQRRATSQTAARVRTADLDALVAEVHSAVDVAGLDRAVASGVCSPVNFLAPDEIPARVFYLGVDGRPGHIAANLDVIRPSELLACAEGVGEEGSVLLVGPSGAGKSVLVWRAARDLIPGARVLRVTRVQDEADARALSRHVRLLRPNGSSPVMVVIDDLGRPHTTGWPHAAALLREIPSVLLLGAARAEDFSPALLVGATRVVEPQLDLHLADALGTRLREQQIPLRMDPDEAFHQSEGLLMEYVALLTTGQRLRQVLATQVAALQAPDRQTQREAARLVTTAHVLGLALNADRLGETLADDLGATGVANVGDALGVLRDEHIAVSDGDTWRGLHELRSKTISELLHENPPPRIGNTLARVATLIDPAHAGWMLRRVAERQPECVKEVVEALGQSLDTRGATASEVASFLEGAERADNALYARATLPILEQARPTGLPLEDLAKLVYPRRNQNVGFDELGNEQFDTMVRRINSIASDLPARSHYDATLQAACSGLDPERLQGVVTGADLLDAIRVLEAGQPHLYVPTDLVRTLFSRLSAPDDAWTATIWSRLAAACYPHLSPTEFIEISGALHNRVNLICAADPSILDAVVDEHDAVVSLTRLLPLDSDEVALPPLPWDLPQSGKNALNESTVACLTRLKDACPELQQFRITTVTASGEPYRLRDHEPGHKDIQRTTFPERSSVRKAVGYQAALRRATSSQTWTEVVTMQISVAADLATAARDIPLRFKSGDNARRRATWRAQLSEISDLLGTLRPPPIPAGSEPAAAHAHDDNLDRAEDETTRVLRAALDAIQKVCPDNDANPPRPLAVAMGLRDAADKIDQVRRTTRALLQGRGSVLPYDLSGNMRRSADFAAALQRRQGLARFVRATDPLDSATEIWGNFRDEEQTHSAELLSGLLQPVPEATYGPVDDPDPASWSLDSRSWVVKAPAHVLDETLALLETLDDGAREQLGPHLVVLCVSDDNGPIAGDGPTASPSVPDQQVSLGFGYQLSSTTARGALLIPPDAVKEWSLAAGLRLLDDTASPGTVAQLVSRSHEAARRRLRRLPEPATAVQSNDPQRSGNSVGSPRRDQSRSRTRESSEAQAALALLQEHVAAEEEGTVSVHLSEVMLRPVTGLALDAQAAGLVGAMAVLHFDKLGGLAAEAPPSNPSS